MQRCENDVFFLPVNIPPRCGVPASWAARHTIVCLDLIQNSQAVKKKECGPQKGYGERDVKSKVAAKKWL